MYPAESGAFTGEISPLMLKDLGCTYVICGHSERREILGESDEFIARKVKCALDHDITPILCVGETKDEHDAGKTEEKIETQVRAALEKIPTDKVSNVVIAYEPIWAIGSGAAATADEAEAVAKLIRQIVKNIAGKKFQIRCGFSMAVLSMPEISTILLEKKILTALWSAGPA